MRIFDRRIKTDVICRRRNECAFSSVGARPGRGDDVDADRQAVPECQGRETSQLSHPGPYSSWRAYEYSWEVGTNLYCFEL